MDAETLKSIHVDYRKAWNEARDESLPEETRDKAAKDAVDLRHKLDAALIEKEEQREQDELAAKVEARSQTAAKAAAAKSAVSGLPLDEIRAFASDPSRQSLQVKAPSPFELRTTTDMTTADTSGYIKYTIPQTWAETVRLFEIGMSGVLQANPTIVNTAGGGQINYPILSTDMTATVGAEGTAATNSTYPVLSTVPLNQYRIEGFVALSDELLRDSGVDLEGLLGRLAGRSLGAKLGAYLGDIDIGSGSSAPAAITVGVTSAVTAASQTAVTFDELKTLFYNLLPAYRVRGSWIGNSTVTQSTALAKDDNGNYLWQPSNTANEPDRLWGRPWFEDVYFDASTTGNIPVVFGDVEAAYVVRFIGPIEVSFSRDYAFTSFETTMRFAQWFDAATLDTIAVKCVTLA